jgi:hypothetical protein
MGQCRPSPISVQEGMSVTRCFIESRVAHGVAPLIRTQRVINMAG